MSAREQRPQRPAEPGQRVVLVIRHTDLDGARALTHALDEIARVGWTLTAIVEPEDHVKALQLVIDGMADLVLAARSEYMPSLRFLFDLGRTGQARTVMRPQRQDRPAPEQPWNERQQRRPEVLRSVAPALPREGATNPDRRPRMLRPNRMAG